MEKVIIAVDAGGTKTKVVAINEKKEIVYEIVGGSGSPAVLKEEAFNNIFKLVNEVYDNVKERYNVALVQMGVSGLGTVSNVHEIEQEMSRKIKLEVPMESDAIIGLYSIIEDKTDEGILVLSGTGSVVAGIKGNQTMLKGGFGQLLTETGSSYASVKMLVTNIINQYEETLTYSSLGEDFLKYIGAKSINDFKIFMYKNTKTEIASCSKYINQKAIDGNEEAIEILKKCGRDLAIQVIRVYKHLDMSENAVMGFRGSFIQKAAFVKEELIKTLQEANINIKVVQGEDDPIYGAFYMARRKGKI